MSYPAPYTITTSFAQDVANNVAGRNTLRPDRVDAELQAIQASLNATISNLSLIQRSDNALKDGIVTQASLSPGVLSLFSSAVFHPRGAWLTATAYALNDMVETGVPLASYVCLVAHTSGTFATDKAAGKWMLFAALISSDPVFNTLTLTNGFAAGAASSVTGTLTVTTLIGAIGTAAQTGITSVGTLTALTISGLLTLTAAASQILPGATSFAIRNSANNANNLLIADSGAITVRGTISGATTITATTFTGTLSTASQTNITAVGTLVSLTVAGASTLTGDATHGGRIVMSTAVSKFVPGATSLSLRNNADGADNLIILDNGNATLRGTLTATAGHVPAFESAEQSVVVNTTVTAPHSLGRIPKQISVILRCKTAEGNYSINDEVPAPSYHFDSASIVNTIAFANATSVGLVIASVIRLVDQTTHGHFAITPANWRVVLRAW